MDSINPIDKSDSTGVLLSHGGNDLLGIDAPDVTQPLELADRYVATWAGEPDFNAFAGREPIS